MLSAREPVLYDQILNFLRGPSGGDFEALALEAFAFQFDRIPPYRRLCRRRGRVPGAVTSWRDVPAVPALAFKSLELSAQPGGLVFRSSGTTGGGRRSLHRNPFPDLYRAAINGSFPPACLPSPAPLPMLSLIPSPQLAPDSSLSFMVDHVLRRWASRESTYAVKAGGLDVREARRWLQARQGGGPVVVLATALALAAWLEALEESGEDTSLPVGSVVFETGGFKGRRREVARRELVSEVERLLGIPRRNIVREYGMTELSSQFYTRALAGGDEDLFVAPPWTRVRILDPADLSELASGRPGLVSIFDLANLGSAVHLLTEDLGVRDGVGFRLLGRASGSELRGCSLTAEELDGSTAPLQ